MKGICDKCVGPSTCECFVSSTDVLEGAGPSSAAGRPTPSLEEITLEVNAIGNETRIPNDGTGGGAQEEDQPLLCG